MSGDGQPQLAADGTGLKVTIVSGLWHHRIAEGLLAGAHRFLAQSGAEVHEVQVPGSFELPVVAEAALDAGADAVVALGVIVRGETPHFEFVAPPRPMASHESHSTPGRPSDSACSPSMTSSRGWIAPACPGRRRTRAPRPPTPPSRPRGFCRLCGPAPRRSRL